MPTMTLNDGNTMPRMGMGLWRVEDAQAAETVRLAVEAGYRCIDTAAMYKNETGVGKGIRDCGLPREQLFVATKLWNTRHGYDETLRAFDESMNRLKLEYLDLYLIHWPVANSEKYLDSWKAFIRLREKKRIRSIGVSNFTRRHLDRLVGDSGVAPAVNQIEYHPYFKQPEIARANAERDIVTQAWAPLGRGGALEEPLLAGLGKKYGKTPAQVALRWHVEHGFSLIPKTVTPARMRENLDIFDFRLTPEETADIDAMTKTVRIGQDPDVYSGLDIE